MDEHQRLAHRDLGSHLYPARTFGLPTDQELVDLVNCLLASLLYLYDSIQELLSSCLLSVATGESLLQRSSFGQRKMDQGKSEGGHNDKKDEGKGEHKQLY